VGGFLGVSGGGGGGVGGVGVVVFGGVGVGGGGFLGGGVFFGGFFGGWGVLWFGVGGVWGGGGGGCSLPSGQGRPPKREGDFIFSVLGLSIVTRSTFFLPEVSSPFSCVASCSMGSALPMCTIDHP